MTFVGYLYPSYSFASAEHGGTDADPDYLLSVEDLTAWEAEHGELADGTALLRVVGWVPG